jgi:hypothetical protein
MSRRLQCAISWRKSQAQRVAVERLEQPLGQQQARAQEAEQRRAADLGGLDHGHRHVHAQLLLAVLQQIDHVGARHRRFGPNARVSRYARQAMRAPRNTATASQVPTRATTARARLLREPERRWQQREQAGGGGRQVRQREAQDDQQPQRVPEARRQARAREPLYR